MNLPGQQPGSEPDRIRFEGFEADLRAEELLRAGRKLRLAQQSFRVLAMLLEKPGQLVTRQELRARLWPSGTLVEYDQGLNTAVNRLREALGDSADAPRFIETLPKRGYRFIASIEPQLLPDPPAPASDVAIETKPPDVEDRPGPRTAGEGGIPTRRRHNIVLVGGVGLVLAVFVATLLFLATRQTATRPATGWQVVPFTSLPGQEIAPTFSPDGSQIAFGWNGGADAGNQFDLYVKSLESERLLRLTHQPALRINPAWSPDGSRIAFVRRMENSAGIFIIPALGGSERRVVGSEVAVSLFQQISWSPDGRQLAYSAYGPRGSAQVYLVALDSLDTRPLAPAPQCVEAGEPAFSPDGRQIAFVCMSSIAVYAIDVVQLPDGPLRSLATVMGYPQGLAWAADGKRLVFSKDPGDGGELWQLSSGGELTQLPFGEEASEPVIAPKGERLAYVRRRGTLDIWRADLTAPRPEETASRLIYSTRTQMIARYSPDGKRIAFQSNRSGSTEIWLTDADGGNPERMTSFNGPYTSAPSWCSDGRRIAFDSRVSGISAVYVEDIGERVPRKVITTQDNLSLPVWSQDCRWLFANDTTPMQYRFAATGGPAERFTEHPSNYALVVGDRVIFNAMQADGVVLWSKPVDGGPEAPLKNMPQLSYGDAWVATAAGIYWTESLAKPVNVNFYDFRTQTQRTLMTLKQTSAPAGPGLAVSPDGRWLLYGQVENEQSEIMLGRLP
jgi:Tol biopolymer transport system component/DNA-binding winged helix-turn-helix (wHTH) protein